MRRTLVGLVVAAVVCALACVGSVLLAIGLLDASGIYSGSYSDTGPSQEAQDVANIGWTLSSTTAPLAAGALIAVVALLALLALRRQLRRAPAPSETSDPPAAGTP
jgi:hypothetical protein